MAGAAGGGKWGKFYETRAPEGPGQQKKGKGHPCRDAPSPFTTLPEQRGRQDG